MSVRTKLSGMNHLLRTYATAAPRILYCMAVSVFFDPKTTQRFVHQVLNASDLEMDDPVLGSSNTVELFCGEDDDVAIVGPYYSTRSSDVRILMKLASLAKIMRALKPTLVFEIGTFVGRTTRLLAINSPSNCRILTLDLDPDQCKHKIGEAFLHAPDKTKISQFYGDSRTFDFSPWFGQCDFVWVDACHDYNFVVADTKNALKLCRPGGWIGWHDYRHTAWWSGVTRCVREVHREHRGLRHVRGTTMALLKVGELAQ